MALQTGRQRETMKKRKKEKKEGKREGGRGKKKEKKKEGKKNICSIISETVGYLLLKQNPQFHFWIYNRN